MKQDLMNVDNMSKDELIQELIQNQVIPNDQIDLFKKSSKDTLEHLVTCARAKWENKSENEDSEEVVNLRKENEELKSQNEILSSEKNKAEEDLKALQDVGAGDVVPSSEYEELKEKYKQKDLDYQSALITIENLEKEKTENSEIVKKRRDDQQKKELKKYLVNLSDQIKSKANSI